jgi:ribosome maturation factor RimP
MAHSNREAVLVRVNEIVESVGRLLGVDIVEVQLLGGGASRVLRIYIDKADGVTHGDCEKVSREVGALMDAEDIIADTNYTLEVSSPGVERKLGKLNDFERFAGQKAKLSLIEPVEDKKFWEGTLRGIEGNDVALEPSEGKTIRIPFHLVRKANLKFEW